MNTSGLKLSIVLIVVSILFLNINTADARLVTHTYEARVISTGAPGYEVPSFSIGDTFQLRYTFESNTPDSSPDDSTVGNYVGAIKGLSFNVGSYSGHANAFLNITVMDNYTMQESPIDAYLIYMFDNQINNVIEVTSIEGWALDSFILQFLDPAHEAFTSDVLPTAKLDPSSFIDNNYTYMSLGFAGPNGERSSVVAQFIDKNEHVALVTVATSLTDSSFGDIGLATDGHAWIEMITLSTQKRETYGTFCDMECTLETILSAHGALHTNIELEHNYQHTASRSLFITQQQYDNLMNVIGGYRSKADWAWNIADNCTAFAQEAWKAASKEKIDPYFVEQHGLRRPTWPNPISAMNSIINLNEGMSDRTTNQCNSPYCSSPCPPPATFCK